MLRIVPAILLLLIIFSIEANAAKYYKWQDENGVTHYTSIAPAKAASETINTHTGEHKPSIDDDSEKVDPESGDSESNTRNDSTKPTDKPEDSKTEKLTSQQLAQARRQQEENCEILRKNFETLSNRPRVRVNDPDTGELRYLTPEEQLSMKNGAKEQIEKNCG